MTLDYFYGQSGELFSYFRIPKALFQDHRFRQLSTDARTLYGILLDRMSLSAKNGWLDEQGRVYIIYTVREVQESLCCAEHKAVKLFRELEDIDLIERKRRGLGRPSLIYVKDFSSGLPKAQVQNCPNSNSGAVESAILEQSKPQANKTDKNKIEWNDPDPIYSGGIRGSHIHFVGMNPEITLREHQRNAIAHVLYGGNTLLAHEVGAGKTYEMAASAMEAKRLGLCQKSLFVVPNHLTEQWASEFLNLYPNAKLLVARRKDFETANRKKFCARIATGDYDAVIIGHSQFERIPLSFERQERIIQEQIYETLAAINELKVHAGENFSIKQMEKTRKTLETKLEKLRSDERKDDVITFEQLGVDRLFVDESHFYKNRAKRCA